MQTDIFTKMLFFSMEIGCSNYSAVLKTASFNFTRLGFPWQRENNRKKQKHSNSKHVEVHAGLHHTSRLFWLKQQMSPSASNATHCGFCLTLRGASVRAWPPPLIPPPPAPAGLSLKLLHLSNDYDAGHTMSTHVLLLIHTLHAEMWSTPLLRIFCKTPA